MAAQRRAAPLGGSSHPSPIQPVLRFTPDAWAKLLWLRDRGGTEIGGFGIAPPEDPLKIIAFQTVRQQTTCASVQFEDEAVAEFFEDQVDAGRRPDQFARHWIHTHPGHSATPSGLDETTFERVFGVCDWAVMCIVAKGGATYARLRFNVGPGGEHELPIRVDYTPPFHGSDTEAWEAEYHAHVVQTDEASLLAELDPLEAMVAPDMAAPIPEDASEIEGASGDGVWLAQHEIDPALLALLDGEDDAPRRDSMRDESDLDAFEDEQLHQLESEEVDDPAER